MLAEATENEAGMKVNINIDVTPEEARTFFGLPDVTPLNEQLVAEMQKRLASNMEALEPDSMMRAWMSFGGEWQKSLMGLMSQAAGAAAAGSGGASGSGSGGGSGSKGSR